MTATRKATDIKYIKIGNKEIKHLLHRILSIKNQTESSYTPSIPIRKVSKMFKYKILKNQCVYHYQIEAVWKKVWNGQKGYCPSYQQNYKL